MNRTGQVFAAIAAFGAIWATPALAAPGGDAEQLRRLDIMLMVTGLRCRTTPDDFQADFHRFEAAHMDELNSATREMRDGLVEQYGLVGANRALDRLSTSMANQYGQGHPWLSCGQLKSVAQMLARSHGREALAEAADQLLTSEDRGTLAYLGR